MSYLRKLIYLSLPLLMLAIVMMVAAPSARAAPDEQHRGGPVGVGVHGGPGWGFGHLGFGLNHPFAAPFGRPFGAFGFPVTYALPAAYTIPTAYAFPAAYNLAAYSAAYWGSALYGASAYSPAYYGAAYYNPWAYYAPAVAAPAALPAAAPAATGCTCQQQ